METQKCMYFFRLLYTTGESLQPYSTDRVNAIYRALPQLKYKRSIEKYINNTVFFSINAVLIGRTNNKRKNCFVFFNLF